MLQIGSVFADLHGQGSSSNNTQNNSGLFFDALTERVYAVRTEGSQSVFTAHSLKRGDSELVFSTKERGEIRSICLSPDLHLASIQQEDTVVDFLLLSEGKVQAEFRQVCRSKGAIILGLHWLAERQIAFVTDAGCEFYQVNGQRRALKMTKSVPLSVNWFSYFAPSKLFLFASGIPNNLLQFHCFQNGTLNSIGKLELDFGQSPAKPRLLERDIALASLYGRVCMLALKFELANGFPTGLNIFEFAEEQPQVPSLKCFLRLDLVGLVGVQVLDNLVLVHHKNARHSLLFDVQISSERPIHSAPLGLAQKLADHLSDKSGPFLYSSAWKMSPQGFILDMNAQIFSRVELVLERAVEMLPGLEEKIQFLLNRKGSEELALAQLQGAILGKELKFKRLAQLLRQILQTPPGDESEVGPKPGKWALPGLAPFSPLCVSHDAVVKHIFDPLYQHPAVDKRLLANLMVDFFLSLKQRKVQIQNHYLPELLLKIVADAKMWTCLQQLLQYRVIEDSKFLAFELISRSAECPALFQIALDMLSRRGNSEQIAEVLLQRGQILDALRFISEEPGDQRTDKICLELIKAAWNKRPIDRPLKFSLFSHLERIGRLKGLEERLKRQEEVDEFKHFSAEFECLYADTELKEAEQRFRLARLSSIRRGRRDSQFKDSFTSTAGDENDQLLNEIREAETGSNNAATDGSGSSNSA